MKKIKFIILLFGALFVQKVSAQDISVLLDEQQANKPRYVPPTFKMTRIAFGHSTEVRPKNVLELFVANRFWTLPEEKSEDFLGLKLNSRIALEYGLGNRLTVGAGASTFDGYFDAHLKYRAAIQQKDGEGWPVTLTLLQNITYNSDGDSSLYRNNDFGERTSFTSQLLVSRRFSKNFSLQVSPTLVNNSLGATNWQNDTFFAIGAGGRFKIGKHLSLIAEYYHLFDRPEASQTYDPLAFGVNWELGDIMLQFMLTNSFYMVEDSFLTQTKNTFGFQNPNLNFGFNATYVFHLKNRLKK